jgi:hypothetical protein
LLRDATIVCIAGIDWSFSWQVPQEIAEALGGAGNHVVFV